MLRMTWLPILPTACVYSHDGLGMMGCLHAPLPGPLKQQGHCVCPSGPHVSFLFCRLMLGCQSCARGATGHHCEHKCRLCHVVRQTLVASPVCKPAVKEPETGVNLVLTSVQPGRWNV